MTNEPVAWIAIGDNTSVFFDLDCALSIDDNPTPLYTHPANKKVKENTDLYEKMCNCTKKLDLTDEEIDAVWFSYKGDIKDFARAILRKAQEK